MRVRNNRYIDFNAIKEVPNKYNLTPQGIKKLKILDWDKLKKVTWHNEAMKRTGEWWCHLEGCGTNGKYLYDNEFWIGFRKEDNKIDFNFTSYEGMCGYVFDKFYNLAEIENKYDMQVQVNAMRWLNKMIDEGILAIA